jgi:hypothetical protein
MSIVLQKSKRYVKPVAILIAIGVAYLIFVRITGFAIPCPIHLITGYKCPGCGITSMFIHLSKLNFQAAFWDNPFLALTSPYLLFEIGYEYYFKISGKPYPKWHRINSISIYIYIGL